MVYQMFTWSMLPLIAADSDGLKFILAYNGEELIPMTGAYTKELGGSGARGREVYIFESLELDAGGKPDCATLVTNTGNKGIDWITSSDKVKAEGEEWVSVNIPGPNLVVDGYTGMIGTCRDSHCDYCERKCKIKCVNEPCVGHPPDIQKTTTTKPPGSSTVTSTSPPSGNVPPTSPPPGDDVPPSSPPEEDVPPTSSPPSTEVPPEDALQTDDETDLLPIFLIALGVLCCCVVLAALVWNSKSKKKFLNAAAEEKMSMSSGSNASSKWKVVPPKSGTRESKMLVVPPKSGTRESKMLVVPPKSGVRQNTSRRNNSNSRTNVSRAGNTSTRRSKK